MLNPNPKTTSHTLVGWLDIKSRNKEFRREHKRGVLGELTFQYNPLQVPITINNNLTEISGPSIEVPSLVYGGKSGQTYEFQLFVNEWGDPESIDLTNSKLKNAVASIQTTYNYLKSLMKAGSTKITTKQGVAYSNKAPSTIIFSFGIIRARVVIASMKMTPSNYNTKDLHIKRATIDLNLRVVPA